ncbi:MAG: hypothetical protein JW795_22885 [Chitinivibrionales bacterium]|nr:hypothetical protein [Chitinivibrionales bacterium]
MVRVVHTADFIELIFSGWDIYFCFKRRLRIKKANIVSRQPFTKAIKPASLRFPGMSFPGMFTAGTYIGNGRHEFWCKQLKRPGFVYDLCNEKYTRLVLDIDIEAETV